MTAGPSGEHLPDEGTVGFENDPVETRSQARAPQEPLADSAGGETPRVDEPDFEGRAKELTADLQRLQAEYVNYKRRVDRDRELVLQNAKFSILSTLLPVLDAIDRAREHGELDGGFKAVAESLEKVVEGQGLHKFGASGDEFDPHRHEALMHGHSPDVKVPTCQNIVQAGYQLGDRVVRPAQVTVVDPEQADPPAESLSGAGDEAAFAENAETEPEDE